MKIAIVGGGGVGGYLGAKLSKVADVDIISSSLKELFLIENGKKIEYKVNIHKTPPKDKIYDFVIFTVKSYVLEEATDKIKNSIDKNTKILTLLNGIYPYEKLKDIFPKNIVLKGAIYIISNKVAPNTIELKGKGALVVTEDKKVADIFQKAGIKVKIPEDIDKATWQKYLFIAATASLTTYYNATFGQIAKEHLKEFEEILDEIIKIANKKGVNLNEEDKKRAIELLKKSPSDAKTSMQLDFEKKEKSEIENILGYLIKEGDKLNISLPLLEKIYTKLLNSAKLK